MLNLTSFLDFYQREVVMSPNETTAQTPVVTSVGRTVAGPQRTPVAPESPANDPKSASTWSIGTTRAAKEHPARREECPPEVYIG
jgi:hypothetical protein